ncbi:MAG: hypothetical protein WB780_15385 [Candidatus Acidiferrales bacterium]
MSADSDSHTTVPQVLSLELEILRSLCIAQDSTIPRDAILRSLAQHAWQDPEHRIVYEALRRLGNRSPALVRAELPAAATRMGFPDVDWKPYLDRGEIAPTSNIEALIRALAAASGSPQT